MKEANNNFETEDDQAVLEQELVALAIFGIEDPLRDTIVDSIRQCHEAGITVIMCTGDNIDTATAISKNAGIITEDDVKDKSKKYVCMTGHIKKISGYLFLTIQRMCKHDPSG